MRNSGITSPNLTMSPLMQIALFGILLIFVMVFMKITTFEKRLDNIEKNLSNYVTSDQYMETFNGMWNEKLQGRSVSPYSNGIDDNDRHQKGEEWEA